MLGGCQRGSTARRAPPRTRGLVLTSGSVLIAQGTRMADEKSSKPRPQVPPRPRSTAPSHSGEGNPAPSTPRSPAVLPPHNPRSARPPPPPRGKGTGPSARAPSPVSGPATSGASASGSPAKSPAKKAKLPPPPPVPRVVSDESAEVPVSEAEPWSEELVRAEDPELAHAQALVELCKRELEGRMDPLRAARIHFEIGRLLESPIGDLVGAAEHYQEAYRAHPDHVPTLRGARRVALGQRNYPLVLSLLDAEVRLTSDPHHKAWLTYEKGRVLEERMGKKSEAREAFTQALAFDTTDLGLLKAAERAEEQAGDWASLEKILEHAANAVQSDDAHRAALLARRARIIEMEKGDTRQAVELFRSAVALDGDAPGILRALKRLLYSQERWGDLVDVLELETRQAAEPRTRGLAFHRMARVLETRLNDTARALSALERAAHEMPEDVLVLEELARLYEHSGAVAKLVGVLERLAGLKAEPTHRLGTLQRLGELCERDLENEDQAEKWFTRALAIDPSYLPALERLEDIYRRRAKWRELVAMLVAESGATNDLSRRAAVQTRIGEILETRLEDPETAMQHHARALSLVPGYQPAFKSLVRLYAHAGKNRELIELYERTLKDTRDPSTQITYLFKIGRVYEDVLALPAQAYKAYERVLAIEAGHIGAIHAMQRAAEQAGRYADLVHALELEVEQLSDPEQIKPLLLRAGDVCADKLDDPDGALVRYRRVLTRDPKYMPVLLSMGRVFQRLGRWEELLDAYDRQLFASPPGPAGAALLHKMGELCEQRIGDQDEAVRCYRRALALDPFYTPSLRALGVKLAARGQWKELVKLLELELSGLKDTDQRARTAFRLGEVYENRLGALDRALGAYEQALQADEDYRPARDARARLLAQSHSWRQLVDELSREAATTRDPCLKVGAQLEQGDTWREELGEPRPALECYEAVVERDPTNLVALLSTEALYSGLAMWEKLAATYTAQSRVLSDVVARAAALRELARLQQTKLSLDPTQIKQTYLAILQLVPNDLYALTALETVAMAEGNFGLLAHLDAKLAAIIEDPRVRAVHEVRLAEYLEAEGDPAALETFRTALARDPENHGALRGLSRLALRSSNPELLEDAAEREAAIGRDLSLAAEMLRRSAELRAETGQVPAAVKALERVLELHPAHEGARRSLQQLLLAQGEVDHLLEVLTHAALASPKEDAAASLWMEVADLLADHKEDLPAALAALDRVLESSPDHLPTLLQQSELLARDERWEESCRRLERVVARAQNDALKISARLRLATILDEKLANPARALLELRAVLGTDPQNREAMERLVEIQSRTGPSEETLGFARRLVEVVPEPSDRAQALVRLAKLERSRHLPEAAAKALDQAVRSVGLQGAAAQEFRDLLLEQKLLGEDPAWSRYVAALEHYLEHSGAPAAELVDVTLEAARVSFEELGRPDDGLALLYRGVAAYPDEDRLRQRLAARLTQAGHAGKAIRELRSLLDKDAMNADTWRMLVGAFAAADRTEESILARAPLVVLGAAHDADHLELAKRPPRPGRATAGSFDALAFRSVDPLPPHDPASDMLSSIAETLPRLYTAELERYRLSLRDRITVRSGHPLRLLTDRVAQVFGPLEYDLYVHSAHAGLMEVEMTDPIGILVPSHITHLGESQQTFLFARLFANLARGLQAVDMLPPENIALLLAAAARNHDPGYGAGLADEEYLNQQARRVSKAMGWRTRRIMEDAAARYAASRPPGDFNSWAGQVRLASARAALIICDDLPAALALVRRYEADLAGLEGQALARGVAFLQDLMKFWVSEAAMTLRRRLGMAG